MATAYADKNDHPGKARMRVFDAVLCDIDGVLRCWPPADPIELAHGLPRGSLLASAFAPARLGPAVTGAITDDQWRAAVADDLATVSGSASRAAAAVAAWSAVLPAVDSEVAALLARARRQLPVVLVSNGTTRLEADLRRQHLQDLASAVVNSARVGAAKPDPRIYLAAAQEAAVPPGRCLFVDDTPAHVTAARALGMIAVRYRHPGDLAKALAAITG
jgi:putative hydrolase of the HAD superfamily